MPSKNLKNKLEKAAKEKNIATRGVQVAAVIAEALKTIDQEPILVGGSAVEFYTEGNYTTKDIDLLAPGGPTLRQVMENLGFQKWGKDYIHEKLKLYIEFPGEGLDPNQKYNIIDINDIPLKIISLEDLIVDRLASYKFWNSEIDGVAVLLLLESGPVDQKRLNREAQKEDVFDVLRAIQDIYQETIRKRLSKEEATRKLKRGLQGIS